jgi:hypothetical protein
MTKGTRFLAATLALAATTTTIPAWAEGWADRLSISGAIQSDIRYITDDWRGERPGQGHEFEMNRNDVDLRLRADPFDNVQAVVSARLRFYGFNNAASLPELIGRNKLDSYELQLNEAYVAIRGVLWSKMDIKIGRMTQTWGTADMFNPTDNLSARDFSDPLDYAAKVPNQMIEIDLYPSDWMTLQLVWVPIFKPANLPPSAVMGFAMTYNRRGEITDFPAPPLDKAGQTALMSLKDKLGAGSGNSDNPMAGVNFTTPEVRTVMPKTNFKNSQFGARAKFKAGPVDFSASYYYGRFCFPVAYTAVADVLTQGNVPPPSKFVTDNEELDASKYANVRYVAEIIYPRMQVVGLDLAYSSDNQWVPGFFAEAALIFPERVDFGLEAFLDGNSILRHKNGNVSSTPFIKATAGMDWSYRDWFYINLQYVRGFFDEFNDMYGLHNYLVFATEFKFKQNEVQLRFAGAFNGDDLSAVFYPQLTWIVAPSVELVGGYMHFLGETQSNTPLDYASKSKFGMKANGRNVAFFRAKVTF